MKDFKTVAINPARVRKDLAEFDKLLKSRAGLSEQKDLLPFFKKREQLSAFLGNCVLNLGPEAHLAHEFPFLGDFAADLIVGNRQIGEYLVIELEDGPPAACSRKPRARRRGSGAGGSTTATAS